MGTSCCRTLNERREGLLYFAPESPLRERQYLPSLLCASLGTKRERERDHEFESIKV